MGRVRWRWQWWWWWWCVVVVVMVVVMQSVVSTPVVMNGDTHVQEWRRAEMSGQETLEKEPVEMKEEEKEKEEEEEMKPERRVEKNEEKWRTRMEMIAEKNLVEEKMEAGQKMIKAVEMKKEDEEKEKSEESTEEEQKKISEVKEKKEKVQEMITKQGESTEKRTKHGEEPEKKNQVESFGSLETAETVQEMSHARRSQEKIKEAREEEGQHLDERRYIVKEEELPILSLHPQEVDIVSGESYTFQINLSEDPAECLNITLALDPDLGTVAPSFMILCNATADLAETLHTTLTTSRHGTATLTATAAPEGLVQYESGQNAFSVVSVMKSKGITTTADVLGWMYTIAWDVSFLPQILRNWQRKSVVGLSFDFLTFNFIGFSSYLMFNAGMFWIAGIQDQYEERHPQSILHVRLNDVIFPLYALICTAAQILQCFFYERAEGQRISIPCRILSGLLLLSAVVGCILVPLVEDWWWIDVLYLLSYVKLAITCVKYVPQLYVNYSHRSTEAWSIYQVILDFTGGVLSLVQMFLLSANYDDWESLLTDPAKLGLGLLSILFNILFFIQHYCLYRHAPSSQEKPLKGSMKGEDGPMAILEGSSSSPVPLETAETGLGKKRREEEEEEEEKEEEEGKKEEAEEEEKEEKEKKKKEEEKKEEKGTGGNAEEKRREEKTEEERREEREKEEREEEPRVLIKEEEVKKEEERA